MDDLRDSGQTNRFAPMRLAPALILVMAALAIGAPLVASGAVGDITTVAGGGAGDGGPASAASVTGSAGIALDAAGNLYIADPFNHRIRKVLPSGEIVTVAGSGGWGFEGDGGPATKALISNPIAVAVDGAGNLFFIDSGNVRVRKVDVGGIISTVAGNGASGFSGDGGPATAASLNDPQGVAILPSGEVLIADRLNHRVRKVAGGTISTVAGNGQSPCLGCSVDEGVAATATAIRPRGLASDGAGGFHVISGDRVRHVTGAGVITTVAGNGGVCVGGCALGDGGPALAASLYGPNAVSLDAAGDLYVADSSNSRIRKVASGIITTVAGNGANAYSGDGGPATAAALGLPGGVAAGVAGAFYIADTYNERIRKVDGAGAISTFAGLGPESWPQAAFKGNGLLATDARFHMVGRALTDASGDLLVPDDGVVRRVDSATGIIGPEPVLGGKEITRDLAGNLYWIDGNRVMRRAMDGTVAAVAGNGYVGDPPDGAPAIFAPLKPVRIALDASGTLHVGQRYQILKVDGDGRIRFLAGNGSATYSGDSGPAKDAGITVGEGLAADGAGNVYFIDHNRLRKVDTTGVISRIAGNGDSGYAGDGGPAVDAVFARATGLAADPAGNVYVVDGPNYRVRRIDTAGMIDTVAGNGVQGFGGNGGPATQANLHSATEVTWDPAGHLFLTESNFIPTSDGISLARTLPRIRKVTLDDASPAPFAFPAVMDAAVSTLVQSAAVTPGGFTAPASISASGGEYSVDCSGTFTSGPGTIQPGQSVCVRHTSAPLPNQTTRTAVFVGGVRATFDSRSAPASGSLSATPGTLDFGGQSMGIGSPPLLVTLANTGSGTITVYSTSASWHYGVEHGCTTLAPGESCVVTVTFLPLAPGTLDSPLAIETTSGNYAVPLAGAGERSLTTHYYRSILRRDPDAVGKDFWNAEAARMAALGVDGNETWNVLAMAFFASPEYASFARSNADFVRDLYGTFYNREPDAEGSGYWVTQLEGGMPREVLLPHFLFSTEFANFTAGIFGPTATRAEIDMVTDFYRGLLGRLPDDAGFAYWLQRFRAAQCTGFALFIRQEVEEISRQFATSSEYAGRSRTAAQYVGDLYNAFMRRGGDLPGVAWWIGELEVGRWTREQARQAFLNSPEFQARVAAVISQGCLP